jgi:hypothetical protein
MEPVRRRPELRIETPRRQVAKALSPADRGRGAHLIAASGHAILLGVLAFQILGPHTQHV